MSNIEGGEKNYQHNQSQILPKFTTAPALSQTEGPYLPVSQSSTPGRYKG